MLKRLPQSHSVFRDIIENDYLYIDKTESVYEIVSPPKGFYFLSRPRRFGKSLLVSTLDELFQGNRELFKGLWIDSSDYNWKSYPILRFDFSLHSARSEDELDHLVQNSLNSIAQENDVQLETDYPNVMLEKLILQLAQKNEQQQVVVLIDEYDKPIIDHLDNPELAKDIRDRLKSFYAVLKARQAYIRLIFITGVSKFSKVGIFSELNNLTDLTMRSSFATALGITEDELRHNLADHIADFAQKEGITSEELLEQLRQWYDGFCFAPEAEHVYNPFSTMQLFESQQFYNYWFESGTPTFLIKLLKQRQYNLSSLRGMKLSQTAFSTYDIESLALPPLLYQTGYLTIKEYDKASRRYTLGYPNIEVEDSLLIWLMGEYSYLDRATSENYVWILIDALEAGDLQEMFTILSAFFANIPYDLHIAYEKYYHTIFYILFMMIGYRAQAEVQTNDGRIDAVVEVTDHIYLFEFKLDKDADEALEQIKNHKYYEKYILREKPIITLVGANFNSETRTVDDWKHEAVAK